MEDFTNLTAAETIVGVLAVLGGLLLAMKRVVNFFGYDVVRKNGGSGNATALSRAAPPPIGECPDPGCHRTVEQIGEDLEALCDTVNNDIFPKINRTAESVARIEGYIQGQTQGLKT